MARTPQIANANNRPEVSNRDDNSVTRRTIANVSSNLGWIFGLPSFLVDCTAEIRVSRGNRGIPQAG
jgi:hypothetical protein